MKSSAGYRLYLSAKSKSGGMPGAFEFGESAGGKKEAMVVVEGGATATAEWREGGG